MFVTEGKNARLCSDHHFLLGSNKNREEATSGLSVLHSKCLLSQLQAEAMEGKPYLVVGLPIAFISCMLSYK